MTRQKSKQIFFTSDMHFGHLNVIRYSNRPFKTLEEMHDKLISNWNRTVKPNDIVYVLGDVSMNLTKVELRSIISSLNGTKILVRGNHDMMPSEMLNLGFSACVENAEITIAKKRVILSHFPFKRPLYHRLMYKLLSKISKRWHTPRVFVRQLDDNGMWLLHGHCHSKKKHYGKRMIHVGVDAWSYTPVPLQKIANMITSIERKSYKEIM